MKTILLTVVALVILGVPGHGIQFHHHAYQRA